MRHADNRARDSPVRSGRLDRRGLFYQILDDLYTILSDEGWRFCPLDRKSSTKDLGSGRSEKGDTVQPYIHT